MSDSGINELAEGALLARAAEPAHGEAADGHTHETACLNCGTPLLGSHCHACGQAAHVHKTIGAFFHDLLHGVFHFEGKIWRTLPLLAWNPGRLTREYIDGRRASYVSPIALFLFCVFLMFAVVRSVAPAFNPAQTVDIDGKAIVGLDAARSELAKLQTKRAEQVRDGTPTADVDKEIAVHQRAISTMEQVKTSGISGSAVKTDIPWLDERFKVFRDNPSLALYKLQNNAYKLSWALIPISVPFVWLLFFWKRRFGLYDHTVFVTYSLCFMTLLVVLVSLGMAAGAPGMAAVISLVPPWHMYRQLRGAYGLSRGGAVWRTAALLGIAITVMIGFTFLIFAESAV